MLRFVALLAISLASSVVVWPVYVASAQNATSASTAAPKEQGARRAAIRFLTDSDFPPFNFLDEEGSLTGFHVDLARAICAEAGAT